MKEKILSMLKSRPDYISGQDICNRLGVSRTAVWKNINALRAEGYQIDSVNNRGYKLLEEPDRIDGERIYPYLHTQCLGGQGEKRKRLDFPCRGKLLFFRPVKAGCAYGAGLYDYAGGRPVAGEGGQ